MIEPPRWRNMIGAHAWMKLNADFKFTLSTASHCASLIRSISPSFVIPALFTSTSIEPKSAWICFTTFSVSSKSAALPAYARQVTPRASISLRVASSPAAISSLSTRSVKAMFAPSLANFIATALPMPRAAPVTRAVFPVNNPILSISLNSVDINKAGQKTKCCNTAPSAP